MQMVKTRLTNLVDGGFHAQMVDEPRPQFPNVAYCRHLHVINTEI